jgi:hypothetical protein
LRAAFGAVVDVHRAHIELEPSRLKRCAKGRATELFAGVQFGILALGETT